VAEVTESFREEPANTDPTVVKSEGQRRADASQEDLAYVKNFINDLLSMSLNLLPRPCHVLTYYLVDLGLEWKNRQFPWGNMAKDLAALGVVLVNWEPRVPLPGDARNRNKGISDLTKEQRALLRSRCHHPTHPLRLQSMPSKQTGQ
jgi:hypothetical protein